MVIFSFIITVVVLAILIHIYDEYETEMDNIKREVKMDYKNVVRYCKLDPKVLQWLSTLNDRFETFINSKEYQTVKPYDKFVLKVPTSYTFLAFMVIDKDKNLKLTVNFEPSVHDEGRTNKYLKYCVGYNNGLKEFIADCKKEVMEENLEKKRIKNAENVINK